MTLAAEGDLSQLRKRFPLTSAASLNRYALECGLTHMLTMPTLLPEEISAKLRSGAGRK